MLLENLIFMFLRGHTDPKQYKWMTKVTWYSEGGHDVPGMPIAEWWATDYYIDQFARIDNSRGEVRHDLGNHAYACLVDHLVHLRSEPTIIGQVETRSEHSTASFIECLAGIAYAHVTKGLYMKQKGCGFIEIEPVAARQ